MQPWILETAINSRWRDMANYHRNLIAGDQLTSMKQDGKFVTKSFDSLKDDFAAMQTSLPNIVQATTIGQSEQGADIQALRIGKNRRCLS